MPNEKEMLGKQHFGKIAAEILIITLYHPLYRANSLQNIAIYQDYHFITIINQIITLSTLV